MGFPLKVHHTFLSVFSLLYGKGNLSNVVCNQTALDRNDVVGKVVLCDNNTEIYVSEQLKEVERVGVYAAVFLSLNISYSLDLDGYYIPSRILPAASENLTKEYV